MSLRQLLRQVIQNHEAIALTAGNEAISLGAEGNLDGEKKAKLIEAIARNTLRELSALVAEKGPSGVPLIKVCPRHGERDKEGGYCGQSFPDGSVCDLPLEIRDGWPAFVVQRFEQDDPIRPYRYVVLDGTQNTDFSNCHRYAPMSEDE